jgi:hypothetical protein
MYYQILTRESKAAKWELNFSDKSKEAIDFEIADIRDHGTQKQNIKLLTFKRTPSTRILLAALDKANAQPA